MSDKYKKLIDVLRAGINPAPPVPIFAATVKAITAETCSVEFNDMLIDDVRLKATVNGNANRLLLLPKIDTMVLVGSLTNDFKDLVVLKIDELEFIKFEQDGLNILIDANDGKIKIENVAVSFLGIMQQLIDLLKAFKVYTPSGPSGTALPDTLQSIIAFETNLKKLLK